MSDSQNIYPVFEKHSGILKLKSDCIEMDIAAVDTLLTNSILYTNINKEITDNFVSKLNFVIYTKLVNSAGTSKKVIENCFMEGFCLL